jgi:hypothetical protein
MFQMEELQRLAATQFESQLQQLWASETFPECIREVYRTSIQSPAALRTIVIDVTVQNRVGLLQKRAFKDLLREGGDFALDLVQELTINPPVSE